MAEFPKDPGLKELGPVFEAAFRGSGKEYEKYKRSLKPSLQLEVSPAAEMLQSAPLPAAIQQIAPYQVGDTMVGRLIASVLPESLKVGFMGTKLGGMSPEDKKAYSDARADDPDLRRATVEIGKAPLADGTEVTLKPGDVKARATQAAGVVAADLASDGMRNVWWFLNAPQAVAQVAMFQGMRQASANQARELNRSAGGQKILDENQALIRNRNLRMAAAAPAWIATSMGIGNFMRQPGYKAAAPSETDPRSTDNPAAELVNRYFLGRAGRLLPYEEFVKERPDVSRQEYNAYKRYLFEGSSPIKATIDGIQGPEVTFMGKSIPLATGILPMAGAVLGARRGIKRGVQAVGEQGYRKEAQLQEAYRTAKDKGRDEGLANEDLEQKIRKAKKAYEDQVQRNESKVAGSVIANTSAYTAGSALSGYVLESMRRALKGRAPQSEESDN